MQIQYIASDVTYGSSGASYSPWQANCENRTAVNLYFGFSILLLFNRLLHFFYFSDYFPVI